MGEFEEAVAQCREGAMDADFGGAGRDVEELGDLLVRQVLEAVENEDLALFERKFLEGGLHDGEVVAFRG